MSVRFSYIYRDASNYKGTGETIFAGSYSDAEVDALVGRMRKAMSDGENFVASQVGVPSVFLWDSAGYAPDSDDHGWHEFSCIELVDREPTDSGGRTFAQFVDEMVAVGGEWEPPEPTADEGRSSED